jgi:hypothetical protein
MPTARTLQVFISPGAIRFVSTVIGNSSPVTVTVQRRVAFSMVSQGTGFPSGPGRSVTRS